MIEEALTELRALTTCRCRSEFALSNGHESECVELWREDVEAVAARIAELEAAAQPQPPKLCGCADAERTYEQLLDYTAELGEKLDRQRVIVRAAEALVECDAAKPGLGQSISVWRRQRRELLDILAAAVRALLEGEGR